MPQFLQNWNGPAITALRGFFQRRKAIAPPQPPIPPGNQFVWRNVVDTSTIQGHPPGIETDTIRVDFQTLPFEMTLIKNVTVKINANEIVSPTPGISTVEHWIAGQKFIFTAQNKAELEADNQRIIVQLVSDL